MKLSSEMSKRERGMIALVAGVIAVAVLISVIALQLKADPAILNRKPSARQCPHIIGCIPRRQREARLVVIIIHCNDNGCAV